MSNQFLKLRRSAVPGKIPTTSSLEFGEIALNTYDGLAFMKRSGSNGEEIITIGSTSGSFTGSLFGTASWAENSITASYVLNAVSSSYAKYAETASSADNFFVRGDLTGSNALFTGTITAQKLIVQTVTSSVVYSSGSNQFGNKLTDTQQFTGSVTITGSLGISGPITEVDYIQFETTASGPNLPGKLIWNNNDGTLNLGMKGGNVTLQIGQEFLTRVHNLEPTTIVDGQLVAFSGSVGDKIGVKLADATFGLGSSNLIGMVTEAILPGEEGFVTYRGFVRDLNTTLYLPGEQLFLDTVPGGYNNAPPDPPNASAGIGYAVIIDAVTGSIYVDIKPHYALGGIDNVLDNSTTNSYGDLFIKSGSVWTNSKSLTGSYSLTGSLIANSLTGSLQGTASWAEQAITASYVQLAQSASYVLNSVSSSFASTASYVQNAQSASYVLQAVSASLASTASYVNLSQTASYVQLAQTASYVQTAQTASYVLNAVSSSFASTASFVTLAQSASFVTLAQTASYVLNAVSSSFASTASFVTLAQTASFVSLAQTASYVLNAVSSSFATTGSYVQLAQTASYVLQAVSSSFASTASFVVIAQTASYVQTAQTASYVLQAVSASFATTAQTASYVLQAVSSSFSTTASYAVNYNSSSLLTTASAAGSTITFTKGDGSTFNVTITTGGTVETASYVLSSGVDGPLGMNSVLSASNARTASYVQLAQSASYVLQAVSSSFATSASYSVSSSYAQTASYGINIVISGSINNADYIQFNTSSTVTDAVGRLYYNSGEGTLNVGLAGGNVIANIGEDLYQYIYNATGAPLTKGQVVYISGSQGNRIAVKLASATAEQGSANTIGFVAEAIGTGAEGWVITEGVLRKINTTGLIAGQLLYLSTTPGAYTQTEPEAPNHGVRLGYPERIDNTVGSIYVKIDNGWELGEIHDVIDTTTTASYGDLLVKSGSAWYNSKQLTGSYGLTGSLSLISGSIALSKGIDPGAAVTNTAYLFASASEDGVSTDLYYRHSGNLWNFDWYENITDTGIIYGGIVSFTSSITDVAPRATEVRITPGLGLLVDHNVTTSSKGESVATLVPFGPITQSFKDFITSSQVAYLYIDSAGQLQTQTSVFNVDQYHNAFPLGVIFALTTSSISSYGDQRTTNYGQQQQAGEFIRAFGPLKVSGYDLTPQSGSLKLSIAAGTTFRFGGFYTQDPETPSNYDSPAVATGSLFRVFRDPAVVGGFRAQTNAGLPFTDIDPTKWDDGSGTLKTVGSGEFTIQRLFQAAVQGVTYVYYGQAKYTSLATAIQNITAEQFTESPTSIAALPFIGYVITEGTSTNLADTGSNRIINSGLFRNTAGSSGGGGAAVTSLNDLSDVNISGPSNGEALVYNSGVWINSSTVNSASFSTSASLAQSASYVLQAVSASFATTASFVTLAQSASYVLNAVSSSYSTNSATASYVQLAHSASYVQLAQTASYVQLAQSASYVLQAVSASFVTLAQTASYVNLAQTASFVTLAQTSSYVLTAQTASYVNLAQTASFVATASWANNARTASFVTASDVFGPFGTNSVITASYAVTAAFALNAGAATSITVAEEGAAQGTATFFNFIGAGVTVAPVSSNTASITIPGGGGSTFPYTGSAQITGSLGVTGSVSVIQGGFTGSLFGTASYVTGSIFTSTNPALTASFATTASYVLQAVSASYATTASYSLATKAGNVTAGTFTGNPRKATVTFGSAFPNTSYAVTVTGEDSRAWSIESKLAGSFVINANSNTALAGTTYWIATQYNS